MVLVRAEAHVRTLYSYVYVQVEVQVRCEVNANTTANVNRNVNFMYAQACIMYVRAYGHTSLCIDSYMHIYQLYTCSLAPSAKQLTVKIASSRRGRL